MEHASKIPSYLSRDRLGPWETYRILLRTAAFVLAGERVLLARQQRGLYP